MAIHTRNPQPNPHRDAVLRHLIECRSEFLGFLRRRLADPQDAEDAFQDFCFKVIRSAGSAQDNERINAWLGTILRNTLTDHYRRRATRRRLSEAYANEALISPPDAPDETDPACRCIVVALPELKPAEAALVRRADLAGEPRASIAADLGITPNALGVRLHRARQVLRTKIAETCPTCGDGGFMHCDCELEPAPSGPAHRRFETWAGTL